MKKHILSFHLFITALTIGSLCMAENAYAKTVFVRVSGDEKPWMTKTATDAVRSSFSKAGHQLVESETGAEVSVLVNVEKAYSHHAFPWFHLDPTQLVGNISGLWNYDVAHATVTTTITEGGREISRKTGTSSKRDIPILNWLQKASTVRRKALRSAVQGSVKEYLSGRATQTASAPSVR